MKVLGEMLIGQQSVRGTEAVIYALDPVRNEPLTPMFGGGGKAEVDRACHLAAQAYESFSKTTPQARAQFIESIAENLMALGDGLVERVMAETGLLRARVEGEQARTAAQLRMFASYVREGTWRRATIDSADPYRNPPKPDLRLHKIAIGPVGVFGSSNFPLLYSVAGGDTASAFAAGCPVVVKAHFSHLGTSELVGRAIQAAVAQAGFHEGVFSLLMGSGNTVGELLVDHPAITAVGFTGSEAGGMALVRRGQERRPPIPVFAEMTSINPIFLLPSAQSRRGVEFAKSFIHQMVAGAGQMCLKPGLIVAIEGDGYLELRAALHEAISTENASTMLSPGIHSNYSREVAKHSAHSDVSMLGQGEAPPNELGAQACIFEAEASALLKDNSLTDEMFGPAAMLVRCTDAEELLSLARHLGGQLSMTIQMESEDLDLAKNLLPILEKRTNRILANGFSNAVEISDAMIHGGPFPATNDSRFTSVGTLAIDRFLRPVCYQNLPTALLPKELLDDNPFDLWRILDGEITPIEAR